MMSDMRIRSELTYEASPAEVHAMLADPAFRERVCATGPATSHDVTVTPAGRGMTVVVDQTQPATGVPGFARKVVGEEIHIVQTERWTGPQEATLDLVIPDKPGRVAGTIALSGRGSGTTQAVEGEVTVALPLVGGKLEKLIGDLLAAALRHEEEVGRAWLAGRRS